MFCSFRGIAVLWQRLWWRWTWKTKHSCCPGEQLPATTMSLWSSETRTTPWSSYRNSREEIKPQDATSFVSLNHNTDLHHYLKQRQSLVWEYVVDWFSASSLLSVFQGLGAVEVWKLVEKDWGGKSLERRGDQCQSDQLWIWYMETL